MSHVLPRSASLAIFALAFVVAPDDAAVAQSPDPATLEELPAGQRVRVNGPAIQDAFAPSITDVLFGGGLIELFVHPPVEGVVVEATVESFRFDPSGRRRRPMSAPWAQLDHVDAYRGRSVVAGTLQGAGLGTLTGLVGWGLIELIFLGLDNPVVDPKLVIGVGAGAGALFGAASLGERWERVYPPR